MKRLLMAVMCLAVFVAIGLEAQAASFSLETPYIVSDSTFIRGRYTARTGDSSGGHDVYVWYGAATVEDAVFVYSTTTEIIDAGYFEVEIPTHMTAGGVTWHVGVLGFLKFSPDTTDWNETTFTWPAW